MDGTITAGTEESLEPVDAFKIVGNETRLRILHELTRSRDRPVSFAELRRRVGLRDGSQFNYHLGKLESAFVRKTDEGYSIRHAGLNVIRAVVAGHFTDHPRIPPFKTGGTCVRCAGDLVAWYEHEMVIVQCSACDSIYSMGMFSPGGLHARSNEEVLTAFNRRVYHDISLALDGVCVFCDGTLERKVILEGAGIDGDRDLFVTSIDDGTDHGHAALYRCVQCDFWAAIPVGAHLRTHPTVVGFYWDHGIDLREVPDWELEWCLPFAGVPCSTVRSLEPLVFEVTMRLGGEMLRVTLDEDLTVVDTVRESGDRTVSEARAKNCQRSQDN